MNSRFALDRSQAKWMGVCAGLSRSTGIDPTGMRVLAILATLFALGPIALGLYVVTAMVAPNG